MCIFDILYRINDVDDYQNSKNVKERENIYWINRYHNITNFHIRWWHTFIYLLLLSLHIWVHIWKFNNFFCFVFLSFFISTTPTPTKWQLVKMNDSIHHILYVVAFLLFITYFICSFRCFHTRLTTTQWSQAKIFLLFFRRFVFILNFKPTEFVFA